MQPDLDDISQALLGAAKAAGAEAADAIVVSANALSVEVRTGALEHAERSEGIEVGLRVLMGHRQACVSSSDIRKSTFAEMALRAVAMANEAPADPTCGLADPAQLATGWDIEALELADAAPAPAPDGLQEDARRAEAAALAIPGVSQVQGAGANWSETSIHLAASNGFSAGYRRTSHAISCVAITGTGTTMERDYSAEARHHAADLPPAEDIGALAGQRAVARLNPKRPPTGAFPVLFDERISSSLIGHLVAAINGTSIVRGASWLKDAMGELVLPESLTLFEDPTRPRVSGSKPFDGEGLPTRARALIRDGVLQSWTLDLATARKLGLQSTGNAARGIGGPPTPSIGNLTLTPGTRTRDDLIADMGTGMIITSMIGSSVNPTTGDYSRGASGFWVENGEITGPVNECTVAGNLRDMMRAIHPANDARPHLSRRVPSLLVEGLTIAGA
jgi:PmbA protein